MWTGSGAPAELAPEITAKAAVPTAEANPCCGLGTIGHCFPIHELTPRFLTHAGPDWNRRTIQTGRRKPVCLRIRDNR
jgi:hypothetical protein